MHEAQLRLQAKKMNVESLRSNVDDTKDSAEVRMLLPTRQAVSSGAISIPLTVLDFTVMLDISENNKDGYSHRQTALLLCCDFFPFQY